MILKIKNKQIIFF